MKIGAYNVSRNGIYNIENRSQAIRKEAIKRSKKITERVVKQALTRQRAKINNWLSARQTAESEIMPNNTELIRIFKDIEIDSHLFAVMQTIRLKVMANKFAIYNAQDEIDDEATTLFQKKWFRNVVKETVNAEFYGFSLLQLNDIVAGCFSGSELVPREYVVQQKRGVKKNQGNSLDLLQFDDPAFVNWVIPIGDERNLGLLDKAAPLIIKKKEIISAWSEAAELFGMPIRIGKTDINNEVSRANMEDMLENMGEAAFGVFDNDDEIEVISTSKTDFSNMYLAFLNFVNSEISKLILNQTGTTDEKAHVGSARVHEDILADVIESYIVQVEDITNEIVIPICQRHGLLKIGSYIKADNEQKFSPKEMFDIVKELLVYYDLPIDWITETFEVPVEKKATPEPDAKDPKKKAEAIKTKKEESEAREAVNKLSDTNSSISDCMRAVQRLYELKKKE